MFNLRHKHRPRLIKSTTINTAQCKGVHDFDFDVPLEEFAFDEPAGFVPEFFCLGGLVG